MTATDEQWLAARFAEHREHLLAVAYRMLGSPAEADDALQEYWLRLSRSDTSQVRNLQAWLTTGVARVCLDMLRSRRSRREEPLGALTPGADLQPSAHADPERQMLLADGAGVALLVVLEALTPPERIAFVLHDIFDVPFDEIGPLVDRSSAAARQLASRARRRVRGASPTDADAARGWVAVGAFLAAAREGDFAALLELLDPDAALNIERSAGQLSIHGALAVAKRGVAFARLAHGARPAWVGGTTGFIVTRGGRTIGTAGLTVGGGRIVRIDLLLGGSTFMRREKFEPSTNGL